LAYEHRAPLVSESDAKAAGASRSLAREVLSPASSSRFPRHFRCLEKLSRSVPQESEKASLVPAQYLRILHGRDTQRCVAAMLHAKFGLSVGLPVYRTAPLAGGRLQEAVYRGRGTGFEQNAFSLHPLCLEEPRSPFRLRLGPGKGGTGQPLP